MADLIKVLNPQGFKFERKDMFSKINHYPIINKVIKLLVGEEMSSQQDFKAIITNPTAISEMEEEKNRQVNQKLQELIQD